MKLGYGIKPWTPEEEERLKSLISARLRPHEIAVKLHRTVQAVYRRAHELRMSFKRPEEFREVRIDRPKAKGKS
ncbi:MAG TPA: hypothetical protein VE999_07055 [Gemmataceae bacterium]|jgi:RIO-like serine/threonine protein kinase|nr:hypothetical protein [Gemmataceae bacterium]